MCLTSLFDPVEQRNVTLKASYVFCCLGVSFFLVKLKILAEKEDGWNRQVPNILPGAFSEFKTKRKILLIVKLTF